MSIASISYSSLKDASDEAKAVAKKLDKYADALNSDIYKKLNKYNGPWSSNLTTAKNKANDKIYALRADADKYKSYATDLIDLKEQCETTDKSVKAKVSSLTAAFKDAYGIKNNPVVNTISYFFTSIGNSSAFGRWLGDGKDQYDAAKDYLKESIKDWYNFEGGKDLIKGSLVAVLEITIAAIAIVTAAAAMLAGGATLLLVAALIGGVIAFVNGISNLANEQMAYNETQNNDPATGKRRSSINTVTDWIRTDSDSRALHNIANVIDVVNTVCMTATLVSSGLNLLKNGYKWATGSRAALKDIKVFKDVFTRNTWKSFTGKLGNGWTEISTAVKHTDWEFAGKAIRDFGTDFSNNFKGKFMDFSTEKSGLKSTKNVLGVFKELFKGGFNLDNIIKTGGGKIALPCVTVMDIPITQGKPYEAITIGDILGFGKNFFKVLDGSISVFSDDSPINTDVLSKLSEPSEIDISIPDIHIPEINIDFPNIKAA